MKKGLLIILSIMMLGTVGCSKSNENKEENQTTVNENSLANTYFGKVEKQVGNEIELNLAKENIINIEGGEGEENGGLTYSSSTDGGATDIGASVVVSETVEATEATGNSFEAVGGTGVAMKEEIINDGKTKSELEYTGESKSLVIPAGAKIFDFTTGKEIKMSDIKDGAVIRVYTKTTGSSEVVFQVDIVE
ncbi:hypothetical protein [Clostridium sp.]|uniref:hypothetical protein n=1 Tax=Clostridium sp. TaxID=1506 RepID=UPI003F3B7DF1